MDLLGVRGRNSNNDLIRELGLGLFSDSRRRVFVKHIHGLVLRLGNLMNTLLSTTPFDMSKLGPYASYDKETGFHPHPLHDNINYVGSFERLNVDVKGSFMLDFVGFCRAYCYSKLVGDKVIGVEANEFVFDTMSKPVADSVDIFLLMNVFIVKMG